MRKLTKESLDSIKMRVEDKLFSYDVLVSDYNNMRDDILHYMKENLLLKEKLLDLEQAVPEEQRWQNILASKLDLAFLSADKKEFLEINNSINNETFTIIIQRKFGKTPKQLLDVSEFRRKKVIRKNIALIKTIKSLELTITNLNKQIASYTAIVPIGVNLTDEKLEISRKIVDAAIANAKGLAHSFNSAFMLNTFNKLHVSFKEAYQEACSRASDAEYKVGVLTNQNKKIKRLVLQKKYPRCRIYKGHLKRG
jgi:hypothetical protein